jgi:hypothetical protein
VGKSPNDAFHHGIQVVEYVFVPESKDAVALRIHHAIANGVVLAIGFGAVLIAVELNDQSTGVFDEVERVRAKLGLPAKVITLRVQFTQLRPKYALHIGRVLAQVTRTFEGAGS